MCYYEVAKKPSIGALNSSYDSHKIGRGMHVARMGQAGNTSEIVLGKIRLEEAT
jgi:hypothetical protein